MKETTLITHMCNKFQRLRKPVVSEHLRIHPNGSAGAVAAATVPHKILFLRLIS